MVAREDTLAAALSEAARLWFHAASSDRRGVDDRVDAHLDATARGLHDVPAELTAALDHTDRLAWIGAVLVLGRWMALERRAGSAVRAALAKACADPDVAVRPSSSWGGCADHIPLLLGLLSIRAGRSARPR